MDEAGELHTVTRELIHKINERAMSPARYQSSIYQFKKRGKLPTVNENILLGKIEELKRCEEEAKRKEEEEKRKAEALVHDISIQSGVYKEEMLRYESLARMAGDAEMRAFYEQKAEEAYQKKLDVERWLYSDIPYLDFEPKEVTNG